MSVITSWQSVPVGQDQMRLYTARPEGSAKLPGFIVLQEAFGVNHHMRALTEHIAASGFVAACPELYHRTAPGFETGYTGTEYQAQMAALTDEGQEADLRATFKWLQDDNQVDGTRIVSSGYCMGGRASFIANSILPLRAAVSYYGGRIAPALLPRVKDLHAPMLFFWGGLDKHIGTEQPRAIADAMLAAGKPFIDVMFSQADHGFSCDERASYNADATAQARALMQQFLKDNLKAS